MQEHQATEHEKKKLVSFLLKDSITSWVFITLMEMSIAKLLRIIDPKMKSLTVLLEIIAKLGFFDLARNLIPTMRVDNLKRLPSRI